MDCLQSNKPFLWLIFEQFLCKVWHILTNKKVIPKSVSVSVAFEASSGRTPEMLSHLHVC